MEKEIELSAKDVMKMYAVSFFHNYGIDPEMKELDNCIQYKCDDGILEITRTGVYCTIKEFIALASQPSDLPCTKKNENILLLRTESSILNTDESSMVASPGFISPESYCTNSNREFGENFIPSRRDSGNSNKDLEKSFNPENYFTTSDEPMQFVIKPRNKRMLPLFTEKIDSTSLCSLVTPKHQNTEEFMDKLNKPTRQSDSLPVSPNVDTGETVHVTTIQPRVPGGVTADVYFHSSYKNNFTQVEVKLYVNNRLIGNNTDVYDGNRIIEALLDTLLKMLQSELSDYTVLNIYSNNQIFVNMLTNGVKQGALKEKCNTCTSILKRKAAYKCVKLTTSDLKRKV